MKFIDNENGSLAVETTILTPILFVMLLLTMQYAAATSFKLELSDMVYQIGEVVSNRRDIFDGDLSNADVTKLSDIFHLSDRQISIVVEELAYGEIVRTQRYNKVRLNNDPTGRACDIDSSLSQLTPVINSYHKYHSVYRVTLCRQISAFSSLELPDELYKWFEIKHSSTHYGKHH